MRTVGRFFVVGAAACAVACAGILGIPDVTPAPADAGEGGAPGPGAGGAAGAPGGGQPGGEGGALDVDAGPADAAGDGGDARAGGDGGDGGCVANLSSDPAHCGRCFHSCLGGACTAGACQPFALAENLAAPYAIAVDATHVYVALWGADAIGRLAKDAPGAIDVLTDGATATGPNPTVVAVDDVAVYWASTASPGGSVRRCAKAGCAGQGATLHAVDLASSVFVDGARLFFTSVEGDVGSIDKLDGGGLARLVDQTVAGVRGPERVVVDGANAYWSNSSAFAANRAPKALPDGGAVQMIPDGEALAFARGIAQDATRVYFTYELTAGDLGEPRAGFVRAVPKTGNHTASTLLADLQPNPFAIATDGRDVYWTNLGPPVATGQGDTYPNGSVMRCAAAGCNGQPTALATGQKEPRGVAEDATAVYWSQAGLAVNTGSVWKLAK